MAVQLQVEVCGSGPPLVLVPGYACGPNVWFKVVEPLARDHEVHLVTVPGFAGAPPVEAPVSESVRDALADLCRTLGGATLVGHSYGAFLALWAAARCPEAVRSVVAIDGLPFLPTAFDVNASPDSMRSRAEAERASIACGPTTPPESGPTYFDEHVLDAEDAAYLNASTPPPDPRSAGDVTFETLTTDIRPEMRDIRCPVQYLAAGLPWMQGPEDEAGIREFYLERLGDIANLELVVATRAQHFVMIDDPELFLRLIALIPAQSSD